MIREGSIGTATLLLIFYFLNSVEHKVVIEIYSLFNFVHFCYPIIFFKNKCSVSNFLKYKNHVFNQRKNKAGQ